MPPVEVAISDEAAKFGLESLDEKRKILETKISDERPSLIDAFKAEYSNPTYCYDDTMLFGWKSIEQQVLDTKAEKKQLS